MTNNDEQTIRTMVELRAEVEQLKRDVEELNANISDLVTAWKSAKGLLVFVKWLAGLAATGIVIWKYFSSGPP